MESVALEGAFIYYHTCAQLPSLVIDNEEMCSCALHNTTDKNIFLYGLQRTLK